MAKGNNMRTWTPLDPLPFRAKDWKCKYPIETTWEEHDAARDQKFIGYLGEDLWDALGQECERRGYRNEYEDV